MSSSERDTSAWAPRPGSQPSEDAPQQPAPQRASAERYTSEDIARLRNGSKVYPVSVAGAALRRHLSMEQTCAQEARDKAPYRRRVLLCALAFVVLFFLSLCPMGAGGQYYANTTAYTTFSPAEVARLIYLNLYNLVATTTHAFDAHTTQWLMDNAPGYWALQQRLLVVCMTSVCAVLLSVSGMLFQNVFKNPIAGPSMLGVGSGVGLGVAVLVLVYSGEAVALTQQRYMLCYGFGVAILLLVMGLGWLLSRKGGGKLDIMTMMMAGMLLGQLLGYVSSFITLYVMEPSDYLTYFTLSQMLVVDTTPFSWACLGVACCCSLLPIYLMRFKMNGLSLSDLEARSLGLSLSQLRAVALLCGSVMILAAQVHTGMVGMVSLIIPFIARSWFGCEFRHQLTGNLCLSATFLLLCRDLADVIPFVGDGIALGSMVGFVALPVFLLIMTRQTRGWE